MPIRIQRRRIKGWRKPIADAVWVGCVSDDNPGKWGNPYNKLRKTIPAELRVRLFKRDLFAGMLRFTVDDVRRKLKGKDLMCSCPLSEPCHGDVLLLIANEREGSLEHLERAQIDFVFRSQELKWPTGIDGTEVMHHPHIVADDRRPESSAKGTG
jgi:hypothetical protein